MLPRKLVDSFDQIDDLAAVALRDGIGRDMDVRIDIGDRRVEDRRIGPVVTASDQHASAAAVARGIDLGLAGQADAVAQQFDSSAEVSAGRVRDIDVPGDEQGSRGAGVEIDRAAVADQRAVDPDRTGRHVQVAAVEIDDPGKIDRAIGPGLNRQSARRRRDGHRAAVRRGDREVAGCRVAGHAQGVVRG